MELIEFQVTNYRSINDTGVIKVKTRTALVGRNESGKSNILLALQSLNPPDGTKALSEIKDFPRDRPLTEFSPNTRVVDTKWTLTNTERGELASIFPRAKDVTEVRIGRFYKATPFYVVLVNLPELQVDSDAVTEAIKKIQQSLGPRIRSHKTGDTELLTKALEKFKADISDTITDTEKWATQTQSAITKFRQTLIEQTFEATDTAEHNLDVIHDHTINLLNDDKAWTKARDWALKLRRSRFSGHETLFAPYIFNF